ncbi:hypothetical protein GGTG_12422 [Gaeumannomyces tritici R3-111a-1]|uniref:Peptidase S8/S53 domain-containing protein n=1 Tax=Gaeumannomyces tritici (strain R3-111a-1) TaxID=644352 RepID=J3PFZ7_GAET3|nr:hypothetical protein GGTG_12422 [Gaeumannomyces tritici R3-111a-1]EJT70249.1 hypothetical protein GGTG_12422 [Gaeumannomyces tritici R3-111a-1]
MQAFFSSQQGSRFCLYFLFLGPLFVLAVAPQVFQPHPRDSLPLSTRLPTQAGNDAATAREAGRDHVIDANTIVIEFSRQASTPGTWVIGTATTTIDISITVTTSDSTATHPSTLSTTDVTEDLGVIITTITIWADLEGSNTWDHSTGTTLGMESSLITTSDWNPKASTSTVAGEFTIWTTITIDAFPKATDGQNTNPNTPATGQTLGSPHTSKSWVFPNSTSSLSVQGPISATPGSQTPPPPAVSRRTTTTTDSAQEQTTSLSPEAPPTLSSVDSTFASVRNMTSAVASLTTSDGAAASAVFTDVSSDVSGLTSSDKRSSFEASSSSSTSSNSPSQTTTTQGKGSQTSSNSQQTGSTEPHATSEQNTSTFFIPITQPAESSGSRPGSNGQSTADLTSSLTASSTQGGTSNGALPSTSATINGATSTTEAAFLLPTFSIWPPEAIIVPLGWRVDESEPSGEVEDAAVVPCKLWFFFVCVVVGRVQILGWLFVLPPGIYPPGPPPFPVFKFPPELRFQGTLPPWPQFTVGPNHVPTFPSEPDPTKCRTQTASLCSATISFVVSTTDGQVRTISTYTPDPKCAELLGCLVTDATLEATATRTEDGCLASTVTDVTFTCSGTASSDCFTQRASPKSGCSVTATTTSIQCSTATAEAGQLGRRQASGPADGGNIPMCPSVLEWVVWPEDGEIRTQTKSIYEALLDHVGNRSAAIETSGSKNMGVNYWRVNMTQRQAQSARSIPNVAVVFTTCKDSCPDPSTQDRHFRYRFQGKYTGRPHVVEGEAYSRRQMDFLSEEDISGSSSFAYGVFVFDNSSGIDVPVYIVDTGANLDHPEFADIRHKVQWLHARPDYDGNYGRDDSGLPRNQSCPPIPDMKCNAHGTSMLAAVAGASLGGAKRVTPVMARVRRGREEGGGNSPLDFLDALVQVADVYANATHRPGETRGVVNLSWVYYEALFQFATNFAGDAAWWCWRRRLGVVIRELTSKGLLVVVGAGNQLELNAWPALFAAKESEVSNSLKHPDRPWIYIPELLVVGALYPSTGGISERSAVLPKGSVPHIWAPGAELLMAVGSRRSWEEGYMYEAEARGTSFACAYTSGIAAYFIRLKQLNWLPVDAKGKGLDSIWPPMLLKDYITRMAWPRVPLDPILGRPLLGLWNGVTHRDVHGRGYCRWDPSVPGLDQKRRRFHPRPRQADGPDPDPLLTSAKPQCREGRPNAAVSEAGSISFPTEPASSVASPDRPTTAPSPSSSTTTQEITAALPTVPPPPPPPPPSFVCTNATAHLCAPAVVCHAPAHNGCDAAGNCVCLLPDDPAPHVTDLRLYPRACSRWLSAATEDGPARASYVRAFAAVACWRDGSRDYDVRPGGGGAAAVALDGRDPDGRPYSVDVFWMRGCRLPGGDGDQVQDVYSPLARGGGEDVSCPTLLFENWSMCGAERGRGGTVQAGCLVYRLVPTRFEAAISDEQPPVEVADMGL